MDTDRLGMMLDDMTDAPVEVAPSKYWIELNRKNLDQLQNSGYDNFKRTVATNYFTWLLQSNDPQIRFLLLNLPFYSTIQSIFKGVTLIRHHPFSWLQSYIYNVLTLLLWQYVAKLDTEGVYGLLEEPREGNPPEIRIDERLISQDLANSILEFMSIKDGGVSMHQNDTVVELGAGYGRTAYVFLCMMPGVKYIIADIPPALYICERYLSSIFPDRRVFHYRRFASFSEIEDEYSRADIVFLLPHQLELIPPKTIDLFINISSLHEMRLDQITYYFQQISRLTKGNVYLKQWRISRIPFEGIVIRETDYPIPTEWEIVYWRQCRVQTHFFETVLRMQP